MMGLVSNTCQNYVLIRFTSLRSLWHIHHHKKHGPRYLKGYLSTYGQTTGAGKLIWIHSYQMTSPDFSLYSVMDISFAVSPFEKLYTLHNMVKVTYKNVSINTVYMLVLTFEPRNCVLIITWIVKEFCPKMRSWFDLAPFLTLYIIKLKLKLIIIAFLETINRLQITSDTEHKIKFTVDVV